MMQCPQCGTENRLGAIFCRSCGAKLETDGITSQTFEQVTGVVPKDKAKGKKRVKKIILNSIRIVFLALIVVGGLFLLDSFNLVNINLVNWWAVFILIPGVSMAVNGWRRYQDTQSSSARNSLMWGMGLILIAFTFFFNISWNLIFPIVLIGVGGYMLLFRK